LAPEKTRLSPFLGALFLLVFDVFCSFLTGASHKIRTFLRLRHPLPLPGGEGDPELSVSSLCLFLLQACEPLGSGLTPGFLFVSPFRHRT
jgi:hypothetical protein